MTAAPCDDQDEDQPDDPMYEAWCVIANAWDGDWSRASAEWRAAAERWRDRWFATLTVTTEVDEARPHLPLDALDSDA